MMKMLIKAKPYRHQQEAHDFAIEKFKSSKGVAFLMDMGTGKTITTIGVVGTLHSQKKVKRLLVVAPKSIVGVWEDEFEKFADYDYTLAMLGGQANKKQNRVVDVKSERLQVYVINYESAWRKESELLRWNPDMVVCDESTKIKNPQAKSSKCLHKLGRKSRFNIILTGTPVVNNPLDFFSQYKFLDDTIFGGSFYVFRARHAKLGGYQGHQIIGYNRLEELVEKAHSVAYRVKIADAVDLPEFIDETRNIALEPTAKNIYKAIEKDSYAELLSGEITALNVLTKLLRLSQITGGFIRKDESDFAEQISKAKLEALEDTVTACIEQGRKVVAFARFVPEILAINKMLERNGIKYACIYGAVKDRKEQVNRFQNDPECQVFVGQLQTVGMGLTLTAGSVAVYYSLDFNYANYEQSRARIHRIGQKNNCQYIHLVAKGTVDEKILHALKHKKSVADLVVDNWRDLLGGGEM